MTSSSEINLTYTPYMVYRLFMKRSNFMTYFLIAILVVSVILLLLAGYYIKKIYYQLAINRNENVTVKLK